MFIFIHYFLSFSLFLPTTHLILPGHVILIMEKPWVYKDRRAAFSFPLPLPNN